MKYNKFNDFEMLELAEKELKREGKKTYTLKDIFRYANKIKTYLKKQPSKVCC